MRRRVRARLDLRRLRRVLESTPPVPTDPTGHIDVHALAGHGRVEEAVASLKSFFRYAPRHFALIFHDDGSLRTDDTRYIERHLPGARILWRKKADALVEAELLRLQLPGLVPWRRSLIFALKLLDIEYVSRGRVALYMDSDVLVHSYPRELLDACTNYVGERYNEDVPTWYSYAWPRDVLTQALGTEILPNYNAGLTLYRRDPQNTWPLYERLLGIPSVQGEHVHAEQTFHAVSATLNGGRPLPPEYDVSARHARSARPIIVEHYIVQRPFMIGDFADRIAPALRGEAVPNFLQWGATRVMVASGELTSGGGNSILTTARS